MDLELRSGLMAPVHPLGGHLRFPQHDEKSQAALREFVGAEVEGLQLDAIKQARSG